MNDISEVAYTIIEQSTGLSDKELRAKLKVNGLTAKEADWYIRQRNLMIQFEIEQEFNQ